MTDVGSATPPVYQKTGRGGLSDWVRALDAVRIIHDEPELTLSVLINNLADSYDDQPALLGEKQQLTYRDLAARCNQYARWASAQGLVKGSVISLLMNNSPEYIAIWLGLARAGCTVALINTNLRADGLLHSIAVAASASLIVGDGLVDAVLSISDRLPAKLLIWTYGATTSRSWQDLKPEVDQFDIARIDAAERPLPVPSDCALLVYSSGTTGLPKAVNVTHARITEWSFWFAGMMDLQPDDRLYNCLPMYHSVGGIIAIGAPLVRGASIVIRERLSVTDFWKDVAETNCSIIQYVGELCRYLSRMPPHPKETQHRVRLACGNGLHADVWQRFQQRFHVPKILEFYAATEGMISLYNCEGKPGAIGRIPSFLAHRFAITLIRNDPETGQPLRDAAGFCIACTANEVGEAIRQIDAHGPVASRFDGYTDVEASGRKVLSNVFSKGDRWYRAGDLMRRDTAGYFYFVDRIGDTFRWRGENVATTEVASVLRGCPGITDAVVFGVTVPGQEGRAGMAAVVTDENFDTNILWQHLARNLPKYARPLFLRLCDTLEATGTFKLTQRKLADEGYENIANPVWFNDHAAGRFIICDKALVREINGGCRRL